MEKILIVGSGVGGATVARALAGKNKKIVILEKGFKEKKLGDESVIELYEDSFKKQSEEGVLIYRTFMVGGSGVVSCGNGVRVLEEELKRLDVDLSNEFIEAEQELGISVVPQEYIGQRTQKLIEASASLGYKMEPMPKFINFEKCVQCGKCILGCAPGAKWSSLKFLKEAEENGVEIIEGVEVEEILHEGGQAKGVKGRTKGEEVEFLADKIILSAGGLGTPRILKRSGIADAGENLFVDMYVNLYGSIEGLEMPPEIPMAGHISDFYEAEGFLLAPYLLPFKDTLFMPPFIDKWRKTVSSATLGIMTKIKDSCEGRVDIDGKIHKEVSPEDQKKLDQGREVSREILLKVGCDEDSLFSTNVESAHPGGTAAIGKVVDKNFETKIKNVFVCDASLLPEAAGAPPIVTIVALAKKLGNDLRK